MEVRDQRTQVVARCAFATVLVTPRAGGCDVTVVPRRGHEAMPEVESEPGGVRVRLRRERGPRVGSTWMAGERGPAIVVAERRWSEDGTLTLRDEDTGGWFTWRP